MAFRGFPQIWVQWVKNILIPSPSVININGVHGEQFYHRRRLRQGDPLSPLLFVLVTDTLQSLLTKENESTTIISSIQNKALQFTDDALIIINAHPTTLKSTMRVLNTYLVITGLQIKMAKSEFIAIAIPRDLDRVIANILGCPRKYFL
jgi:Reverse transcriptase (RNA-dependent DNA polymerase)